MKLPEPQSRLHGAIFVLVLTALFTSCATSPQTIKLSAVKPTVEPLSYGETDYPKVLATIAAVMTREMKLPLADVEVTIYPSQISYEQGVIFESQQALERLRQQLSLPANSPAIEAGLTTATISAMSSVAVAYYRKVLVNEWRVGGALWSDWIQILSHELTHTAQWELTRSDELAAHVWLEEGFAEWVGYQVADRLGAETLSKARENALESIAQEKKYQTFPTLSQLSNRPEWQYWGRSLGVATTYGQAFFAVEYLIEQKGVDAVLDYFRRFGKEDDPARNFADAFGESVAAFDEKFRAEFARRTGK